MKVSLLKQTPTQLPGKFGQSFVKYLMVLTMLLSATNLIWAEGSKDFFNRPGYRMFLDTRDPQQFKVYANVDEFINVGASHLGFDGTGYISVFRPDGTLAAKFNTLNIPPNFPNGVIENSTMELAGPTGGGTTNGSGYVPGIVTANMAGIWTVVFDYDAPYTSGAQFTNIQNNAPWTRLTNQAQAHKRAILAWDITITTGAAGNNGGVAKTGRVYTNQFNGLINGNGNTTSPEFYVLTDGGFEYRVNVDEADPFRFPFSSNSRGLIRKELVNGDTVYTPIYKSQPEASYTRTSAPPGTWALNQLYLYEPQAAGNPVIPLTNNKIFFNIPDPALPAAAMVTDIYTNRTPVFQDLPGGVNLPPTPSPVPYTTWLNEPLDSNLFQLYSFNLVAANLGGIPCASGHFLVGKGGFFIFNTNIGGTTTLSLDLDGNGNYNDPVDVQITEILGSGTDSIFWDGFNGIGVQVGAQDSLDINVKASFNYGEVHVSLADVENLLGGVRFKWLNPLVNTVNDSLIYFDHREVFPGTPPAVSGLDVNGNLIPSNATYPYSSPSAPYPGNELYLDHWFFLKSTVDTVFNITISNDCCDSLSAPILTGTGPSEICEGDDLVLSATNTTTGIGDLTYTWTGPSGVIHIETINETATSSVTITNVSPAGVVDYSVTAVTADTCSDTYDFSIIVNALPEVMAIVGGGSYCAGNDVTLSAQTGSGPATLDYTWSGPGVPAGMESGTVAGGDVITLTIPNIQDAAEGDYTILVSSPEGCQASTSTNITVNPTPVLTAVSGSGSYCVDEDVVLTAVNSAIGTSGMMCSWNGGNISNAPGTINGDTIRLTLNNVNNSFEDVYTLICSVGLCSDTVTFDVVVNNNPEIEMIDPNGPFCAGDSVTLSAINVNSDTGPINYTWTGPNPNNALFPFSGTGPEPGPFPVTIPSLTLADAGTYTLVLETLGGCQSLPQSVTIDINPTPEITITGGGDVCIGQDVVLTATNSVVDPSPIIFIWTGPNGGTQGVTASNLPCTFTITSVDTTDNGIYTIMKTFDSYGCDATATTTLNVLPGLNIINPTPDSAYCEFNTVVLTATNTVDAGDLTYTWNGPNGKVLGPFTVGSFDPLIAIIDEATMECSGTWTLDVTSSSGCNSNDVQVEVTVEPGVRITSVTGGGEYCFNAPVILNGTGEGSATSVDYTWTDPNGTIIGSGNTPPTGPFPASSTANLPGTYILEVIADSSGCSDSETVTVEIKPLPEVMVLNNDTTLCDLDTLEICGMALTPNIGSFSYVWTTPTDSTITGDASGNDPFCDIILPMQDYGAGPYILVITADGCTSEPDTFNVNLNPNPVISIVSGGGTYCEGDTAQICFTNINPEVVGFFYTCILPDGTQTTGTDSTNSIICIPVSQSGTVCCSIESFDGCVSSLACVDVTFEPSAVLSVTANTPVCANDTLFLSGTNSLPCTGTVTYAWNGPNGFTFVGTAPCGGPFLAELPNPVAGEYCLIAPLNSQCPDTACITVVVNPVPMVVGNAISGGGTFCAGEEVVLTAQVTISDNTDITYVWCQNDVPIPGQTGTVPSGTTITLDLGQVETSDDGEYCLKLTSVNGCVNIPPTCTQVTVNPTPEILTVTGGGTYCEGVDVMLNGTGTPGLGNVTYMWMGPDGFIFNGGPVPSAGPFPATVADIDLLGAGTYTLTVKLGDCQDEASVIVEVNPKPIINIISGGGTFCVGETVIYSFEIDPNGATSVDWTFSCPGFDTSGTVTTITVITFPMVVTSSVSCTITAQSSDGCEAEPKEIQTEVQVVDPPVLDVTVNGVPSGGSSNVTVCEGDEMVLTTTTQPGNATYQWFKDGVLIGETTEPIFPVVPAMAGTYTVTITINGCSATSDPVVVTTPDPPIANDDDYTSNTPTEVSGNVTDNDTPATNVTVTVLTPPSSGTLDMNEDGTFTYTPGTPLVTPITFTYEICLESCPESCDPATVTITYQLECIVPNVITPNGDGKNDVLVIDCIPEDPNNPSRLRVFNRWGDEIASFEPYLNEKGWDGTYGSDKKEVPAATYFYLFERDKNSGDKPKAGYIKVAR